MYLQSTRVTDLHLLGSKRQQQKMRNNCRQREIKSWRAYSYGLRLSVHDMYATHVTIISLICIKNAYAANGHYRMQDHFSLDSNDITHWLYSHWDVFKI
ncbi:DUF3289 family protein [Salmonella enterica]